MAELRSTGGTPETESNDAGPVATVVEASAPLEDAGDAASSTVARATSDAGALEGESAVSPRASACNEQGPQEFLVRSNYLRDRRAGLGRAIQYRTDEYGYFEGFGHPARGAKPPSAFTASTTFMGLPVVMHRKVIPALKCVEEEIRATCADHPYAPHALAGIRFRNTYQGGEVTNHAYGIAIDVDPDVNTCCGCVGKWKEHPMCKRRSSSEYDRMAMPECWVHAFERYGFYWLGHDVLRDTMHFEFLGDPDRILKSPGAAPGAPAPVP